MGISPIPHLGESLLLTREMPIYVVGESPTITKKGLMTVVCRLFASRRSAKQFSYQTAHSASRKQHEHDRTPYQVQAHLLEVERT